MAKSTDPTERIVRTLLKKNEKQAREKAVKLKSDGRLIGDDDVIQFFPELQRLETWSWANIREIQLPHYLILGFPVIFDVEVFDSPIEFETRYRINLATASDLIGKRFLLPTVYERDPVKWRGKAHLNQLLALAGAYGERIKVYLELRNPNFRRDVRRREEFFGAFLKRSWPKIQDNVQKTILMEARLKSPDDMPRALGTRWAYLDTLAPPISTKIEDLFDSGDYLRAFQVHRGAKHLVASPITAALGGKFFPGLQEMSFMKVAQTEGVRSRHGEWAQEMNDLSYIFGNREAIEYFICEIARVKPFSLLTAWDVKQLLRVLEDEELRKSKNNIYRALETMIRLARQGGKLEPAVADFKEMVDGFQGKLDSYQKSSSTSVDMVSAGLGGLIGNIVGGVTGGILGGLIAGVTSSAVLRDFKEAWGAGLYRRINRDQYFVISTVQRIRDLSKH